MISTKLIEDAVKLVINLFEVENIMESTATIKARAIEWYNNIEMTDAEMLAAATIIGSYQIGTSWNDLLEWKEFYFPSAPIEETIEKISDYQFDEYSSPTIEEAMLAMENFHIGEIEAAQRDFIWQ